MFPLGTGVQCFGLVPKLPYTEISPSYNYMPHWLPTRPPLIIRPGRSSRSKRIQLIKAITSSDQQNPQPQDTLIQTSLSNSESHLKTENDEAEPKVSNELTRPPDQGVPPVINVEESGKENYDGDTCLELECADGVGAENQAGLHKRVQIGADLTFDSLALTLNALRLAIRDRASQTAYPGAVGTASSTNGGFRLLRDNRVEPYCLTSQLSRTSATKF
ncbi:unnamed protein product [Protopolystoma xenopodis]|uniref:Uncharacterized protein n=1 Tax=Protopolystoma xenopodis TaxID=117903 RepID=A0A3S4ZUY1_9PLAT|nr:unnamed protein product [Protopolystoma xenopodis]